jgi:hypothetical protein
MSQGKIQQGRRGMEQIDTPVILRGCRCIIFVRMDVRVLWSAYALISFACSCYPSLCLRGYRKLVFRKYDPIVKKHVLFEEAKLK